MDTFIVQLYIFIFRSGVMRRGCNAERFSKLTALSPSSFLCWAGRLNAFNRC
jgi:hypothetical protein